MKNITIGRVDAEWRAPASPRYYAQRGDGEEYGFGATAAEALASLERREAAMQRSGSGACEEAAFLALGASNHLREAGPVDLLRFDGYLGLVTEVARHAPLLSQRWKGIGPEGFSGVWLYDVTERFGREWARTMIEGDEMRPEDLLDSIIDDNA